MAVDTTMPVLVVDDYKTMVRIIRSLLKQLGFDDIDEASDGREALAKMRRRHRRTLRADGRQRGPYGQAPPADL